MSSWRCDLPGYDAGMFIRQGHRVVKGKREAYWALVESFRTASGSRQRVVAWLGR